MPMFFVTFMELVFWIPNSLTIQIGWDRFGGGTRLCGLCAKRTFCPLFSWHGSRVQLRWAHRPEGLCSVSCRKSEPDWQLTDWSLLLPRTRMGRSAHLKTRSTLGTKLSSSGEQQAPVC